MKAKLIVNGKVVDVEVSEEQIETLKTKEPIKSKKTGYERVRENEYFYFVDVFGQFHRTRDYYMRSNDNYYAVANYYSDKTVAENNARADKLLRQLRRFAVEHRENELDWSNPSQRKNYIYYNYQGKYFKTSSLYNARDFGQIYFDSEETAELAIDTFKDELLWYFTEYKDSL